MLELVARKFERLFNKVCEMHIKSADVDYIVQNMLILEDQELAARVSDAFDRAVKEGRIKIH